MSSTALRQRLEEVLGERDDLLKAREEMDVQREGLKKELASVKVDCEYCIRHTAYAQ